MNPLQSCVMVRSGHFASFQGKRPNSGGIRSIKEAPAAFARPFHHHHHHHHHHQQQQQQQQQQIRSATHTPSRSVPSGQFATTATMALNNGGLSSLQALHVLLGELEHLPTFPKQSIEPVAILRYAAVFFLLLPKSPLMLTLLLLSEVYFVELVYRDRRRLGWKQRIASLKAQIRALSKRILTAEKSLYDVDWNVPVSKAVDYVHVVRDRKIRFMSSVLLVPGDVVALKRSDSAGNGKAKDFVICDKCPFRDLLLNQLKHPEGQSPLSASFNRTRIVFSWAFLAVCALLQFKASISMWPFLLLSSQLPLVLWWLITDSHLKLLTEQLVLSPAPFTEACEDDEFDEEAPPPVKHVYVSPWAVIKTAFVMAAKGNVPHGNLLETLGLLSVLCFTDREGAISEPFLKPVELIASSANDAEIAAVQVGESLALNPLSGAEVDLKAFGLAMLMTSECDLLLEEEVTERHCRSRLPESCLPEQLQSCYCMIARQIGFAPGHLTRFKRLKAFRRGHCVTHLVLDKQDSSLHLFTAGELSEVLKSCTLANVSSPTGQILPLSESLTRKLVDFEWTMRRNDVLCAAFAYRPILSDEVDRELFFTVGAASKSMIKQRKVPTGNFVFVGLLATQPEPKPHFQEFIDDLHAAGIRFALFSPLREVASKAFAERLGLETDWNSCILLSEHPHPASQASGYSALSDIKAKLPRGVSAIRPHLQHVDDIPLHVSIFAECEPRSSAEMIKIYKEAGEVVGVVNSLRAGKSIYEGDIFISYDLFDTAAAVLRDDLVVSFDSLAVSCLAFGADLVLPAGTSPYLLTQLIREARTILQHTRSGWEFFCGVSLCSCFAAGDGASVLVSSSLLLATSICLAGHDAAILKTHPLTRTGSLPLHLRLLRFAPFALVSLVLRDAASVLGMCTWAQSLAFLHPTRPFSRKQLLFNGGGGGKVLILHSTAALLLVLKVSFDRVNLRIVLLSCFISVSLFMWQEWVKRVHLAPLHGTLQKRSKLLFSTKLGMHSPV